MSATVKVQQTQISTLQEQITALRATTIKTDIGEKNVAGENTDDINEQNNKLKQEAASEKSKADAVEAAHAELKIHTGSMQARIVELENKLQQISNETGSNVQKEAATSLEAETADAAVVQLRTNNDSLKARVIELEIKLEQIPKDFDSNLKEEAAKQKCKAEIAEAAITQLKIDKDSTHTANTELENKLQLSSKNLEIAEAARAILKEQASQEKTKADTYQTNNEKMRLRVNELNNKLKQSESTHAADKLKWGTDRKKVEQDNIARKKLEQDIESLNEVNQQLTTKFDEAIKEQRTQKDRGDKAEKNAIKFSKLYEGRAAKEENQSTTIFNNSRTIRGLELEIEKVHEQLTRANNICTTEHKNAIELLSAERKNLNNALRLAEADIADLHAQMEALCTPVEDGETEENVIASLRAQLAKAYADETALEDALQEARTALEEEAPKTNQGIRNLADELNAVEPLSSALPSPVQPTWHAPVQLNFSQITTVTTEPIKPASITKSVKSATTTPISVNPTGSFHPVLDIWAFFFLLLAMLAIIFWTPLRAHGVSAVLPGETMLWIEGLVALDTNGFCAAY